MARVALEIMDLSDESRRLVLRWREDPTLASCARVALSKECDKSSFRRSFFSSRLLPPMFIVIDGVRVGYLRFRPLNAPLSYEISILIDPTYQGKGVGKRALDLAEIYAARQGVLELVAYIAQENSASLSFFQKAGYKKCGTAIPYSSEEAVVREDRQHHALYSKRIGDIRRKKVFIVAEVGSNWIIGSRSKNREMAKKLIDIACEAGCDAVKFQIYKASETYVPLAGTSEYLRAGGIDKSIEEILREHEVELEEIPLLAELCQKARIEFMATSFSEKTFGAIDPYVCRHKVASYEITYPALLDLVACSQKPIFLSTGASTMDQIGWAVDRITACGHKNPITLLQCTACYPAPVEQMNISALAMLQASFGLPVGLSDHSLDPIVAPLLAIAHGATVIEKHYTISRSLPGPDHAFALEPFELKAMVSACRSAEKALGDGRKRILPCEEELFRFAQRGLQATKEIDVNDTITPGENCAFLRPGQQSKGLHPIYLDDVAGKKACRAFKAGEGILRGDALGS